MSDHVCEYGCGRKANFQFKNGRWCCESSVNRCPSQASLRGKKGRPAYGAFKKGRKIQKKECPLCKQSISISNYEKHYRFCLNNQSKQICCICGKEYLSKYRHRKTCSRECSDILRKQPNEKVRDSLKKRYAEGSLRPYGGGMLWYPFVKEGKEFKVHGSYELRTCKILEEWKSSGKIKDWEYSADRILYLAEDEEQHTYFPDFKIYKPDGSFYYLEIKGFEVERDAFKWGATRSQGFHLEVWFKKDIEMQE